MWEILKNIVFAPYNLYKTLHNISPTVKEKPINYQEQYAKAQEEIKNLKVELETNTTLHEQYVKELGDEHLANITKLKDTHDNRLQKIEQDLATNKEAAEKAMTKSTAEKEDLQAKNNGLIHQLQMEILANHKNAEEIKDLTNQLTEKSKIIIFNQNESDKLNAELLLKNNQLKEKSEIHETEITDYAHKRRYLPPVEADKLKTENHQLTESNEKLTANLQTIQKEINNIYDQDVKISGKLISYTKDVTRLMTQISKLTTQHNKIILELQQAQQDINNINMEINTYATIKDDLNIKSYLNATDISMLKDRLTDLADAEQRRIKLMDKLNKLSSEENILSKKVEDQTILYSKRNEQLIHDINDWIVKKAQYYALHDIPLEKGKDTIEFYLKLAVEPTPPAYAWNIDKEKIGYTYAEYNQYVEGKKYLASQKYVPDLVRMSRERELIVVHPKAKESSDIKVNLPYQSKILHPQPAMQQTLVDEIIRKSLHNSGKFIVRKSPVNSGENDKPIYTSSTSKQIAATSDTALSEKTTKRLSYYEHPDLD